MKTFSAFLLLLLGAGSLRAQGVSPASNGSSRYGAATTFLQDYQTVGINPANLGLWNKETKMITFGAAEIGMQLHTNALTRKDIFSKVIKSHTLTAAEKTQAIQDFIYHPVAVNLDLLVAGVSVQLPKLGGFAFTLRQHAAGNYEFNNFVSNLLFRGIHDQDYFSHIITDANQNQVAVSDTPQYISRLFNGTSINYLWYQSYNLSYGRQVLKTDLLNLYGGIGLQYLQGFGIMSAQFTGDGLQGFTANSPLLKIDYSGLNLQNAVVGNGLKQVGTGAGVDIGVTALLFKILKIGVAITDLGSITWSGNSLDLKDTKLDSLKNFGGVSTLSPVDIFKAFNNLKESVGWQEGVTRKVALPARLRFGSSIALGKMLEAGFDIVQPLNDKPGSLTNTYFALGVDFQPIKSLTFSSGLIAGGNTDTDIPFGVAISAGANQLYQFGISVADVLTFIQPSKPTLGLSLGFLRFQF